MLRIFKKAAPAVTVAALTGLVFAAVGIAAPRMSVTGSAYDASGPYTPVGKCGYYYGVYDSNGDGVYDAYSGIYTRSGGVYKYKGVYKPASDIRCPSSGGGGGGGGGGDTPPVTPPTTPPTNPPGDNPPPVTPPTTPPTTPPGQTPGTPTESDGNIDVVGGQKQLIRIGDLGLILDIPAEFAKEGELVKLTIAKASDTAAADALAKAQALLGNTKAQLKLTPVATAFTVNADKDDAFKAPIKADITVTADSDKELVQVFYVNADGSLVPVRTKVSKNGVTFPIPDEGTYITLHVDKQFLDTPGHWVNGELKMAAAHLLAEGYPDGTFLPEGKVTRAEFVALLTRAMGLAPATGATQFTDVAADAWYASVVKAGVDAKLINGMDATHFAPDAVITREQMIALLGRAAKNAGIAKNGSIGTFVDANAVSDWAVMDASAAIGAGLVKGEPTVGGVALNPKDTATRAESAAILTRLFNQVD